jgi:hypothetical protein
MITKEVTMATLTLNVPDDILDEARARLGDSSESVEEFLLSAIEALASEGKPIDAATEAKIREGLDSPRKRADEIDWDAKLRRIG